MLPTRGRSSAGRAPALQAGGRRFEPDRLHHRSGAPCAPGVGWLDDGVSGRGCGVAVKYEVRWHGAGCVHRWWSVRGCGSGSCVLCQCESGSGASLGAHAFIGSDRHAGSFGVLLFQPIFPDWLTNEGGNYVQRRCGDPSVDEAGGSHVCIAEHCDLLRAGVFIRAYIVWMAPVRGGFRTGFRAGSRDLEQNKGIRWMPWHQEAMKDVARCEKPRGAASRR